METADNESPWWFRMAMQTNQVRGQGRHDGATLVPTMGRQKARSNGLLSRIIMSAEQFKVIFVATACLVFLSFVVGAWSSALFIAGNQPLPVENPPTKQCTP